VTIENFLLDGPAGRIECLLKLPEPGQGPPRAAAVVCHPHPLFGGSLHNKVVHAAAGALVRAGIPALRFNFRGVGLSGGKHDGGRGEQRDLAAVVDHLVSRFPGASPLVVGYSFGSAVGLRVGCVDPRVDGLIAIGVPVTLYDLSFLSDCRKPLVIIQAERDQFGALPLVMALAATIPGGARVLPVARAAHNFAGHMDELARRLDQAISEVVGDRG